MHMMSNDIKALNNFRVSKPVEVTDSLSLTAFVAYTPQKKQAVKFRN